MNKITEIISYKHNGLLHRVWQFAYVLKETEDMIIMINDCSNVIDGDGRKWKTKEPAVCYFYKKKWYNIICMLRNNAIYYYCNLSSPYVVDSEGVKYIDYDLDIKLFPNGEIIELDRDEYEFNSKNFHYPENVMEIIEKNLLILKEMIKSKNDPFNKQCVLEWYYKFKRKKRDCK